MFLNGSCSSYERRVKCKEIQPHILQNTYRDRERGREREGGRERGGRERERERAERERETSVVVTYTMSCIVYI